KSGEGVCLSGRTDFLYSTGCGEGVPGCGGSQAVFKCQGQGGQDGIFPGDRGDSCHDHAAKGRKREKRMKKWLYLAAVLATVYLNLVYEWPDGRYILAVELVFPVILCLQARMMGAKIRICP